MADDPLSSRRSPDERGSGDASPASSTGPGVRREPLTYSSYLQVPELLALQRPRSGDDWESAEHDEMLFIVIHQVYELWFRQLTHELEHLQESLAAGQPAPALATFQRVLTILKTLVGQVDILETMTPVSFASFRSRLDSASGFQSAQFREVEFLLGHRRRGMLHHHPEGTRGRERLEELWQRPSLWDSFLRYLAERGFEVPAAALERDVTESVEESSAVQDLLVDIYRMETLEGQIAGQLCERMVDLDEGLQEWRYRHVKMVERTIGTKPGTGGSPGAEYLRKTLFLPLFPDLWAIRSRL